ncbi:MAG: segregation and condensation protein A [Planctomycetota bacterium]
MAEGADYRVDLDIYNGPLDLLLYLIRERELHIHDIPIAEITEQFLAHLEVVKRIDVDRAGDFLLMAATLMLIKSRMLLPRHEETEDWHDEELDPRTDLVRQLLEYKRFKDLSRALAESEQDRGRRFGGGLETPGGEAPDPGRLLADLGADDLLLAFERMMRETLADVDHQVLGEVLPLREVEAQITGLLVEGGGAAAFRDLFVERRDRVYIVSVFLCLLEMLKERKIDVEKGHDMIDLQIRLPAGERPARHRMS